MIKIFQNMNIVKAVYDDIEMIVPIYDKARKFMADNENTESFSTEDDYYQLKQIGTRYY